MLLSECSDVDRLRQIASHLYDLIDAIEAADNTSRSDDKMFRQLVRTLSDRKTGSGVYCPDGVDLHVDDAMVADGVRRVKTLTEQVLIGQLKMIAHAKNFTTVQEVAGFAARCLDALPA